MTWESRFILGQSSKIMKYVIETKVPQSNSNYSRGAGYLPVPSPSFLYSRGGRVFFVSENPYCFFIGISVKVFGRGWWYHKNNLARVIGSTQVPPTLERYIKSRTSRGDIQLPINCVDPASKVGHRSSHSEQPSQRKTKCRSAKQYFKILTKPKGSEI